MSWETDTRTEIKLTSPSSLKAKGAASSFVDKVSAVAASITDQPQSGVFTALWRGGERTREKKLGQFDPPKFLGTIVQDLGNKSWLYPITFYFDGINHHKTAENFAKACEESGAWEIVHPVKGTKMLQLISCREVFNPIDSGNITEFETQWIEPANVQVTVSTVNLASQILAAINDFKDTASDFITTAKNIRADSYAAVQSYANTINGVVGFTDSIVNELAATKYLIKDSYETAKTSFTNAMAAFGITDPDTTEVVVAVLDVMLSITGEESDFQVNKNALDDIVDKIETLSPEKTDDKAYNTASAQEMTIVCVLLSLIQGLLNATFTSRSDVISAVEALTAFWRKSIDLIDTIQNLFGYVDIDEQYYALLGTYTRLMNLYTSGLLFLLQQFYNLKKEIKKTLKRNESPLSITVREYGGLGVNDENYDLFLTSNNLHGDDILFLQAGREITIYVD